MPVADGFFGQFSPSALYLACGAVRVTLARVASVDTGTGAITLDTITDCGEGAAPNWYNPSGSPTDQCLFYNRATSLMVVNTPPPFVPAVHAAPPRLSGGLNAFAAGGGVWAGYDAFAAITFDDGSFHAGRMPVPAGQATDQLGRTVFLADSQQTLYLRTAIGVVSVVDAGRPLERPHISTQGILWQRFEGGQLITYGTRGSGIERVHVAGGSEAWATPVDTSVGPWILAHDNAGALYLRAWGRPSTTPVTTGFTNFPHAVYDEVRRGFLVTWGDEAGVLQLRFVALDVALVDPPAPPAPIPGGGGSGAGPGGSVPLPANSLAPTPPRRFTPTRRAVYPHVAEITDPKAQQSVKLLWDRLFEVTERFDRIDTRFQQVDTAHQALVTRFDTQVPQQAASPAEAQATQIPTGTGVPGESVPGGSPSPGMLTKNYAAFVNARWAQYEMDDKQTTAYGGGGPSGVQAVIELQAKWLFLIVRELKDQGEPVFLEFYPTGYRQRSNDIILIEDGGVLYSVDVIAATTANPDLGRPNWLVHDILPNPEDKREPFAAGDLEAI